MKKTLLSAALALSASFAVPADAGQCGHQYCWGAVAFDAISGLYGYSSGYYSQGEAAGAAQEGCGYNCREVKTFYNQCGAAAIGNNGGYGWGYGLSQYDAESVAVSYCANYDFDCRVLVSSCSY